MPPWIGQGMAAGVRDAANLCWKLAAALRGELPETVLDSYEAERKPHFREITRRAVFTGRIITERRLPVAPDCATPHFSRSAGCRASAAGWWTRHWIPATHYAQGFLAQPRTKATGRQIPQPWVAAADGERVRLDDVLGGRWLLLHGGPHAPQPAWDGVPALTVLPAGSRPAGDAVVDSDGVLLARMARHGTATLALRPDAYVYAAAARRARLPQPPAGFVPAPARATSLPHLTQGAS